MTSTHPFSLDDIGIEGTYTIPQIPSIQTSCLSTYHEKQKEIINAKKEKRSTLSIQAQLDHGSYGNIYLAKRGDESVLVKQPRMAEMNLMQEAILQHLAFKTLEQCHLSKAIPKVYDVFRKGNEVWFSMEKIQGITIADWFTHTTSPDTDTFFLLAHICLLLGILETQLNLDHRDLKMSNLLIKPEASTLQIQLLEHTWSLQCPFSVVVLDFGFACLGSEQLRGKPWVNLGDGVLPPLDPCPKEGRDIFHLLISLLGLPIFRERISQRIHEKIDKWLSVGTKSYGPMARKWSTEHWSYLVSSQPHFAISSCCPLRILQDLLGELKGFLTKA